MLNNYDKIARYYDFLSRIVFFRAQVNAQVYALKHIGNHGRILIVGGGTGWILEEIAKIHDSGLSIVYLEISSKMIELSRARSCGVNEVVFVNQAVEDFSATDTFDVICTPFLFDNFSQQRADLVLAKLDEMLKASGLWLFTDFNVDGRKGKWWKKFLLKSMYSFFKILKIVETSALPDTRSDFERRGYINLEEKHFYGSFIQGIVYQKCGP
jgi:ubiquinone/menaquinone biosynthesis C-methylase UbiE